MTTVILAAVLAALLAQAGTAFAAAGDHKGKTAILCVAFGSSVPKGEAAISATVDAVRAAFPGVAVRTAYTSRIIMQKLAREQRRVVDDPTTALAKLQAEGYERVAVLSTHIIPGEEYQDLAATVEAFASMRRNGTKSGFEAIAVSEPLLAGGPDFDTLSDILASATAKDLGDGAVVLFGHGSQHFGDAAYSALQMRLWRRSPRLLVGTVEGAPTFEDVAPRLAELGVKRVTLMPAMLVAGDHAANDMAGSEKDSWASMLKEKGYAVDAKLVGLGDNPAVRAMFVEKLRKVMKEIEKSR